MEITELRIKVFTALDSRNLKKPSIRKNALDKVLYYIRQSALYQNGEVKLTVDKEHFKKDYRVYKNNNLNGAENSVINTMYDHYREHNDNYICEH